jgi:hypothetical protein
MTGYKLGVSYFYAVTTWIAQDERVGLQTEMKSLQQLVLPAESALDVVVFPSIKRTSGIPTVGQENTIIWTISHACDIYIYTSSGEMINISP